MFTRRRILKNGFLGGAACFIAYPFVKTDTRFYYKETEFNNQVLSRSDQYLKTYMPGFGISG